MSIKTVILAAGKGTRMRSNKAKVLHEIAGKPMLLRVVEAAKSLDSEVAIVYGHDGEQVKKSLSGLSATWVEQAERLGTGHAVQQAINFIDDEDTVLILYGDVPLIKNSTLEAMVETIDADAMSLLTVHLDNPTGYGRIVRFDGMIQRIVEQKDASSSELSIKEVNTGIMALYGASLKKWLSSLQNNNPQEEYYLTDIIEMAVRDGVAIRAVHPANEYEVQGINSKSQLNELERYYQRTNAQELMDQGVTLADANRIDVRGNLIIKGVDSYIDVNAVFEGNVEIGEGVKIGANCVITDAIIKDNVIIKPNSVLESCTIGEGSSVGPFARIRPGTVLAKNTHVGNFVEIKKTKVGEGSKISHLSYIGDAEIGKNVNVGAGTITCNYDGVNKHLTVIKDGAFIGSDTQLVAPVTVGKNATIAAGTTLTKNAPDEALTLSRAKQVTMKNWKRPRKD